MNQQGLLWNMYYVAAIVVRKQINFQSAVMRSERSSCSFYVKCMNQTLFVRAGIVGILPTFWLLYADVTCMNTTD